VTWKFTDPTNTVAMRVREDGWQDSCLVSTLPPDTEILPADPVDTRPAVLADYRARLNGYNANLTSIAMFTDDVSVKAAAKAFRAALIAIPENPAVTGAADGAAMKVAMLTLYVQAKNAAVAAAPAGKTEFDRIAG
jgi:hypothetical protein